MQVVCDGLDLSEAVIKVSRAISNKTTNPILEGIKLVADNDCLVVSATDSDLAIEKKIKAEVKVEGETVVPGKFFVEFIKKLTKERIELILNDKNQLRIKYTDSEGSIQCFNSSEYPSFNKIDSNDFFAISQNDFKDLINKTIFSVAVDDSRPILKGCLLEIENKSINSVALDGYISTMSPLTLNRFLVKSISFRSNCIATSFLISSFLVMIIPGRSEITKCLYSTGSPKEYIQETLDTTITSLRSNKAAVAECLILSMSSLMAESFSIYISLPGIYASGW